MQHPQIQLLPVGVLACLLRSLRFATVDALPALSSCLEALRKRLQEEKDTSQHSQKRFNSIRPAEDDTAPRPEVDPTLRAIATDEDKPLVLRIGQHARFNIRFVALSQCQQYFPQAGKKASSIQQAISLSPSIDTIISSLDNAC